MNFTLANKTEKSSHFDCDLVDLIESIEPNPDIFDLNGKFMYIKLLMRRFYSEIELYLRSAILIDYIFAYNLTKKEIYEFITKCKTYSKTQMDEFTNVFVVDYMLEKWYQHFAPNKIQNIEFILQKYQNYESDLFNHLYKKYVNTNYTKKKLWFV